MLYIVRCSASVYSDSPLIMYSDSLLVLLSDSLLILYSDALLELELFLCQIFSAILYTMVRKYSELILEQVANYLKKDFLLDFLLYSVGHLLSIIFS